MIRRALKIGLVASGVAMLYVLFTFVQVWSASGTDDHTPSSAIIVLGAAQYDGRPSPVYRARLDHAAELYQQGVAKVVIVTGGKQQGDRVGEGRAGFDYLRGKGIPESALKIEVDGTDTYEELAAAAHILDTAKLGRSAVIVSSPYHAFRADAIAEEVGLTPHFSAASDGTSTASLLRETGGVALGRIISYRRLSNLD
jgi:uncharacterized SAM-binding protein YcdF (DUF218 family)